MTLGQLEGKSFIQGGRAPPRQALHRPALVAIRFNLQLKAQYQARRKAGKPAIVAVMRKIVVTANPPLSDNGTWTLKAA